MAKKKRDNTNQRIIEIPIHRSVPTQRVPWSQQEIEILGQLWENDCEMKDIARVLKTRTITAIQNKIQSLMDEGIIARRIAVPILDLEAYEEIMKLKKGL